MEGPACRARKPSLSPASFYLSKENPTATVSRRPAGRAVPGTQLSGRRRAQPPAPRSSWAGTARAPPRDDGPRHPERCFGVCFISRCVRGGDARHKGKAAAASLPATFAPASPLPPPVGAGAEGSSSPPPPAKLFPSWAVAAGRFQPCEKRLVPPSAGNRAHLSKHISTCQRDLYRRQLKKALASAGTLGLPREIKGTRGRF